MARYLLSLILIICLKVSATVYEDFFKKEVFVEITALDISVNGTRGKGRVYYSKLEKQEAMQAWRTHQKNSGFLEINAAGAKISFAKAKEKEDVYFMPERKGTSVISFILEGETSGRSATGVAGVELSDIPRPKGSIRELCLERRSGSEKCVTQVFSLSESTASSENHYRNSLLQKSWVPVSLEKTSEGVSLTFEGKNKWCHVFLSEDTAVVLRYEKQKQNTR